MIDQEILKAIQSIALQKAINPDYDFVYRRICRWYSREFSTPLSEVEKMSEEYVFRTYFEDMYDNLVSLETEEAQNKIEDIKSRLLGEKTTEEIAQEEDEKWHQEMLEEIKHSNKKFENQDNKPSNSNTDYNDVPEGSKPNLLYEDINVQVDDRPDFLTEEE